jgi:GTP diphosphokinase / guanosine-3',5'-bis(diphosphate) 3'-diphosphatase
MQLIEKQKEKLAKLVAEWKQYQAFGMNPDAYLMALRMCCLRAAKIVHEGRLDLAGKPYIQHSMRVAAKATGIVGFCVAILHDAVEDGKELGFTIGFLRDEMDLPMVIIEGVAAISRKEGETYGNYLKRVADNYIAAKAKLTDNMDNADVTRFDRPSKQDQIRCAGYLDKAYTLKSNPTFQLDMLYDAINDVVALHKVTPLVYTCDERHLDESTFYQRIYLGHEGSTDRRIMVVFNGIIAEDQSMKLSVTTYPSKAEYADHQFHTPRRVVLDFYDKFLGMDFVGNNFTLLNAAGVKVSGNPRHLVTGLLGDVIQEKKFVDAIDMFHA